MGFLKIEMKDARNQKFIWIEQRIGVKRIRDLDLSDYKSVTECKKTVPSIWHTKYMSMDNGVSDYQLKADCKIDDYF